MSTQQVVQNISTSIVSKLVSSFDELDKCIEVTRHIIDSKDLACNDTKQRVEQYAEIVHKQRVLAKTLEEKLSTEEWGEATRIIKLINGLSQMIRDDAHEIISTSLASNDDMDVSETNLSLLC